MKKQAQFFIIGSVILGIIILSVATIWNYSLIGKEDATYKKFKALCENYKYEIFEISKYAVYSENKNNESGLILDFTIKFLNYSKSEPNFKLLYVYGNSTNITIFNATNSSLLVEFLDGGINKHTFNGPWSDVNSYSITNLTGSNSNITQIKITIENTKINKQYEIAKDERFYFMALEEKDGETYVCE